jgi:hypothetical protein
MIILSSRWRVLAPIVSGFCVVALHAQTPDFRGQIPANLSTAPPRQPGYICEAAAAIRLFILLTLPVLFVACSPSSVFPTGSEIEQSLDRELASVQGPWTGEPMGPPGSNTIRLDFSLTEQPNGQVHGTGTMKEANASDRVPVTVEGTFRRPLLSLTFAGMVYEGRAVTGEVRGEYTSVAGLYSIRLTAEGYEQVIPMLLHEGVQ